jgi:uncharacterized protein with HEPN domain
MARALSDCLQDILTNIDRVETYTAGMMEADFQRDSMRYDAVERCIERVSEASRGIPDGIKAGYPSVPWKDIGAIGNRIRHGYFAVDASIIWQTATLDLPALRKTIQDIARGLPP